VHDFFQVFIAYTQSGTLSLSLAMLGGCTLPNGVQRTALSQQDTNRLSVVLLSQFSNMQQRGRLSFSLDELIVLLPALLADRK
jgi:hypothetical protein